MTITGTGCEAGQIVPGKDNPTNNITTIATSPRASATIVSELRSITVLICLAIWYLPRLVVCVASLFSQG